MKKKEKEKEKEKEKRMGIWTKISPQEHAAVQMICTKRSLSSGKRVTLRGLLRGLVIAEIGQAVELGEIDPSEFGVDLENTK
jgi:hypothetical protein